MISNNSNLNIWVFVVGVHPHSGGEDHTKAGEELVQRRFESFHCLKCIPVWGCLVYLQIATLILNNPAGRFTNPNSSTTKEGRRAILTKKWKPHNRCRREEYWATAWTAWRWCKANKTKNFLNSDRKWCHACHIVNEQKNNVATKKKRIKFILKIWIRKGIVVSMYQMPQNAIRCYWTVFIVRSVLLFSWFQLCVAGPWFEKDRMLLNFVA